MLVYKSGSVLQILEGPEDPVREMFDVIKADKRHHQVTLLFVWSIQERSFPDWTMAFRKEEIGDTAEVESYNELLTPGFNVDTIGADRAARLLKLFIAAIR